MLPWQLCNFTSELIVELNEFSKRARASPHGQHNLVLSNHLRKFGSQVTVCPYARTSVHSLGVVLSRLCKGDWESKTCSLCLSWQKRKVVEVHLEAAN